MKKGIIISPEDMAKIDWVGLASQAGLDTLAFHTGGQNHDVVKALGVTLTDKFRKCCRIHSLNCEYEEHVAGTLLPPDLFLTHPEYFACDKSGIRSCGERTNWCISNPEMRELLKNNAVRLAARLATDSHRYYFWSADNPEARCHCPECEKFSDADLNMLGANVIAEGIRQADPQASVAYLAYSGSSYDIPKRIAPHKALFMEFAPYVREYSHSIDDPASEVNRHFHDALLKLIRFFPVSTVHVLEYWLDISLHSQYRRPWKPVPVTYDIMKRDIDFYHSLGIENIASFAVNMDHDYFGTFGDEPLYWYGKLLNA